MAVGAHMCKAAVFAEAAITLVTIVFQAGLVASAASGRGWLGVGHCVPWPLSWLVRAVCRRVVQALALGAPIFARLFLACEALGVQARLRSCPLLVWVASCLLPEVLVIHHPGWPLVFPAHPGNQRLVSHQVWHSCWLVGCQHSYVQRKTLAPGGEVRDDLSGLYKVSCLHDNNLSFTWLRDWPSFASCWWQLRKIYVLP